MAARAVPAMMVGLLLSTVVAAPAHSSAALRPAGPADWVELLAGAADQARAARYQGETVEIRYGEDTHVLRQMVQQSSEGLVVRAGTENLSLDPVQLALAGQGVLEPPALEDKYRGQVAGGQYILDRPCARVDIHRRADGTLRERLWIDERSGLLLRRETFRPSGDTQRLVAYLSLEVLDKGGPVDVPLAADDGGLAATPSTARAARAGVDLSPAFPFDRSGADTPDRAVWLDGEQLEVLRRAGWEAPARLAGQYERIAAYALSGADRPPLQLLYSDGLYTLSLFEVSGRADTDALPAGAQRVAGTDRVLYEWPDRWPARLLWTAGGSTFALVGDAPRDEVVRIAEALPVPDSQSVDERIGRGLRRLWSWVSPWS